MGIVEEVGPDVIHVKKGDRVVIPFNVSCGQCFYCQNQLESQCDQSNPHILKKLRKVALMWYSIV